MDDLYDESKELYSYVSSNRRDLMTLLERRAERLGMLREKARHSDSARIREMLLADYETEADTQALQLIGNDLEGVRAFQTRVSNRIQSEIAKGQIVINRCPTCDRIVKTPQARQCLWCGYDWHDRR